MGLNCSHPSAIEKYRLTNACSRTWPTARPMRRGVSIQMINHRLIPLATFVACTCNCLAFEAIRINGWYNRFGSIRGSASFSEVSFSNWHLSTLIFYCVLLLPFFVGVCNKYNPRVRFTWFLISLTLLTISCLEIPGAMEGRWGSATDKLELYYWIFMPLPSIVFIIFGLRSIYANKRMQSVLAKGQAADAGRYASTRK